MEWLIEAWVRVRSPRVGAYNFIVFVERRFADRVIFRSIFPRNQTFQANHMPSLRNYYRRVGLSSGH